jgi:predicted component of type VI protein secretion system
LKDLRVSLDGPAIIGRGVENAIRVEGEAISREHVSISSQGQQMSVTDLSSNGTLLNGSHLRRGSAEPLKAGDVIGVPGWDVIIRGVAPEGEPAAAVVTPVTAAGAAPGLKDKIAGVLFSFTPLEQLLTILSIGSLALLVLYLNS